LKIVKVQDKNNGSSVTLTMNFPIHDSSPSHVVTKARQGSKSKVLLPQRKDLL
jgi:hypothetical protein